VLREKGEPYEVLAPPILQGFKIIGDSMEPIARHGQIVLAEAGPLGTAEDGDLAIVEIPRRDPMFKRIYRRPGGWELLSVNPAHDPEFIEEALICAKRRVWGVRF
jgi:phage repressor protein C with HTH and peptisase S24 domain